LLNLVDSEGIFDYRIVYSTGILIDGTPATSCFSWLLLAQLPLERLGLHQAFYPCELAGVTLAGACHAGLSRPIWYKIRLARQLVPMA
jgi:hypothetical protein